MFGGCIYWKVAQLIHQQNIQWPLTHILDCGFLDERELLHTSVSFVHPTHMPLISMQPRIQTLPKYFGRCKPYTVQCPLFFVFVRSTPERIPSPIRTSHAHRILILCNLTCLDLGPWPYLIRPTYRHIRITTVLLFRSLTKTKTRDGWRTIFMSA